MTAYKGYMIQTSPFRSDVTISKGGQHIATAASLEAAKRQIDELVS